MTTFRDWSGTLAPASYRGVPFFVQKDDLKGGRRLVVHEFPHADDPYVEDLGRKARHVRVTAYLVSDTADADAKRLAAALDAGGAATLSLPMDRLEAHCNDWGRAFDKDRLGFIAFDLDFVREGAGAAPLSLDSLVRVVEFAAGRFAGTDAVPGPLRQAFTAVYQGLAVAGFVTEAAAIIVRDFAATLDAVRATVPLDPDAAPVVQQLIADLYDDAPALVGTGATGSLYSARGYAASGANTAAPAIVDRVVDTVSALADAMTSADLARAFVPLQTFGADLAPIMPSTPSRRTEAANRAALLTLTRVSALVQWVAAISAMTYSDRRSAIQARADVAEAIDHELQTLTGAGTSALWSALTDLQGQATSALSRQVADLAPVLAVEAGTRMPSAWWAHRLYGTPERADELARRNRVKHPLFMPKAFEAPSHVAGVRR